MRFGLFFLMQRDPEWSEEAVYASDLEQMEAAEALGYDAVWIAEHHFNDYGLCPYPAVLAARVAARTTNLRLGMGVSLLPLHHPVAVAEQLAVLDQVSGGRVDVGVGRGGTLQDYQTFGVERADARARVDEGLDLMTRAWSGERFSFQGRFHAVENLRVTPKPLQRPHPPLFIAANSEDSVHFAARRGLPTLSSFFVPGAELRRRLDLYRAEAATAGHGAAVDGLIDASWGMRVVLVAPSREEALRVAEYPFMCYQERLARVRSADTGGALPDTFDRSLVRVRPFMDYIEQDMALIGSPADVAAGLRRYAEQTSYRRVLLLMSMAGLPTKAALTSMDLFAREVMPTLADAE